MGVLRVCLFGSVTVAHNNGAKPVKLTPVIQSLLAYLLLQRSRPHPRDVLVDLFWGNHPQAQARGCLNTTIWRLRKRLEPNGIPQGTYLISNPSGELAFNNQSDYWLDVAVFEEIIQQVVRTPPHLAGEQQVSELENAVTLYTGDLLENQYHDWVLLERERLHNLLLDARYYMMNHYRSRHDLHHALIHGSHILAANSLREDVHRLLMQLFNENGQRSLAVRQYQLCQQALREELNIDPMPETQALLEQITESRYQSPYSHPADPGSGSLEYQQDVQQALTRLQVALETVNQARRDLEQAMERLR